jgi:hypothetical protein
MEAYDSIHAAVHHGVPTMNTQSAPARFFWNAIRIPVLGALVLIEPIVRIVCSCALVLGVIASVVFELSAAGPGFPFLLMLGASLGFGVFLVIYEGLIALFSK